MVMVNDNWSFLLILYCLRYFYLTNCASEILIGDDSMIFIKAHSISLFEITGAVVVWAGGSLTALRFA